MADADAGAVRACAGTLLLVLFLAGARGGSGSVWRFSTRTECQPNGRCSLGRYRYLVMTNDEQQAPRNYQGGGEDAPFKNARLTSNCR